MQNDIAENIHELSGQESGVLETVGDDKGQCLFEAIMRQNTSVQEATQNRLLLRLHVHTRRLHNFTNTINAIETKNERVS